MTGVVKLDEEGLRSEFELDVLEVMGNGFEKVIFKVLSLII